MKKIIYTQRVSVIEDYKERRDCADQQLAVFLMTCGYMPIPIVNLPEMVVKIVEEINPQGIFLTGGNSLTKYGGDAPERDLTEKKLIDIAIEKNIPLFGICRGMQIILDYFGFFLKNVNCHVGVRHRILGEIYRKEVNSFHKQGLFHIDKPLIELGKSDDGIVEAMRHEVYRIAGVMWHPERERPYSDFDINMIQNFFK